MIKLIVATIHYIFIVVGIVTFIYGIFEVKHISAGLPNITQVSDLSPFLGKKVELDSIIQDSGYVLSNAYLDSDIKCYFYLGRIKRQTIFMSSTSELDITKKPIILLGNLTYNYSDDYLKLVEGVCKVENIDSDTFDKAFTPYVFVIKGIGDKAKASYILETAKGMLYSIGMVIGGIAILIANKKAKTIAIEKTKENYQMKKGM